MSIKVFSVTVFCYKQLWCNFWIYRRIFLSIYTTETRISVREAFCVEKETSIG